jgi:hypothetical protein
VKEVIVRILLKEIGNSNVLAGALNGKSALMRLLGATILEPTEPEPLFIDFAGVDVATASFLRESIIAFRDIVRHKRSQFYPVIANPNEAVRDELVELVRARGDVLMTCALDDAGTVLSAAMVGNLDPKQLVTFDLVRQRGETDAGELMRVYGEKEGLKHATAWNNRLASLATLGLIIEISIGRAKRYRPLFAGV